jgi:hypothetical protein
VLENDYATAATTPDGSFAIVYTPIERTLKVDESKLEAGAVASWIDPSDGSSRPAAAPFTTPGKNAAGDGDWALLFEVPSA